jgi:hypothetical protein
MTPGRHKLVHPHKINLNAVLGKLENTPEHFKRDILRLTEDSKPPRRGSKTRTQRFSVSAIMAGL